jgi:phage-related protein
MQLAQTLFPSLMTLLQTVMPILVQIISEVLPIITELLNMLLPPLLDIVTTLLPPLFELIQALLPILQVVIDLLKPIIELFAGLAKPIAELISKAIAPLIEVLVKLLSNVLKPIIPIIELLAKHLVNTLGNAFEVLAPIINNIKGYFEGIIEFVTGVFTGNWSKAWGGVKKIFVNIFEGIGNAAKAPLNFIIKGINSFIRGLNKLKIPDWVPGVGGKGFHIDEIPLLAKGGEILRSGSAIVGEAGAELVDLPRGAKVKPLTNDTGDITILLQKIIDFLAQYFPELLAAIAAGHSIVINGKEVAKATAQDMSEQLLLLSKSKVRKAGVLV